MFVSVLGWRAEVSPELVSIFFMFVEDNEDVLLVSLTFFHKGAELEETVSLKNDRYFRGCSMLGMLKHFETIFYI